jgi:cytochrome c oxidase subunit 2
MSDHTQDEQLAPTPGERAKHFLGRGDVRRTTLLFILWTALFIILGARFYPHWMPRIMSKEMASSEKIMIWFTYISAPIAGIVLAVATNAFLNMQRGDTPPPDGPAIRNNSMVVGVWTVGSLIFVLVAIVWGLLEVNGQSIDAAANANKAVTIEVTGSQWLWTFHYPEQNITTHVLNVPVGVPVTFDVMSTDVNHSFWPVQLGIKVDANDHVMTVTHTTPTKTGPIDVKCAELCGLNHAYMETTGNVMSPTDWNNWVTAESGKVS